MEKNINVITSIKTNYLSWIVIILCVIIVSHPSIIAGFITFFSLLFFAYFVHRFSHFSRNVFTILHHYHHENDNFFSHFSQILLELSLGLTVLPYYYFLGSDYVDIWTTILFTLFYSTVHNYNYGQLRVNDVHFLHHKDIYTNIGPDICDIAFNTKNCKNIEVENTNHYIPNLILITGFILLLKYLSTNGKIKDMMINLLIVFMVFSVLVVSISSVYLYFTYKNDKNDKNDKTNKNDKNKEKEFMPNAESIEK
jgi:flagellar basal body-associated protein FliL